MKKKYPCQILIPANIKTKKTTRQWVHLFISIICLSLPTRLMAQAPTLSYQTPNTYLVGSFAKTLQPKSSGVAAYGASSYNLVGKQLATGFTEPEGITIDSAGNIYVADTFNKLVKKIPKGSGTPVVIGSGYNRPTGVAVDGAGNVYVADNSIYKIPADGSPQVTLAANTNVEAIASDRKGNIYVSTGSYIYELLSGNNTPIYLASYLDINGDSDFLSVAVDSIGNVFTFSDDRSIYEIPLGGTLKFIGNSDIATSCVTVDGAGNVFYVDQGDFGSVNEIPNDGSPAFRLKLNLYQPYAITIDQKGNIFEIDWNGEQTGNGLVDEFTPTGGYFLSNNLPAGMKFNNSTGAINGKPTAVSPATNYTVTAYNSSGSTSATVNIRTILDAGDNLSGLKLSAGTLSPVFAVGTTAYTDTVGNGVTSITATPTVLDSTATVKVNGVTVASGSPSAPIPLIVGNNTITTIVTAADGQTTNTYTVTVTRSASTSARLGFIQLSAALLSPKFNLNTTSYTASVGYYTTSTTVTPEAVDPAASITVNDIQVASGKASPSIALQVGLNSIPIVVTAEDGVTTDTYTITITRAASSSCRLSYLVVTGAKLSPVFNENTTDYTSAVPSSTSSITIDPTTIDPNATIVVNGLPETSGTAFPYDLAVGLNTINIVVTAQNGTSTDTYTLSISRDLPPPGPLNRLFDPASAISANPAGNTIQPINDDGILVHQGLSPNGDGINDFLQIDGITNYPDNKLQIMNRSGQLVFEAKNYDNSNKVFDGHSNKTGAMQLPGTYYYILDYSVKGVIKHQTGFIVIKY